MYFTPQLQVRAYLLPWTSRALGSCKLNLNTFLLLVVYPQSSSFSKCQEVYTLVVLNVWLRSAHKVGHNVPLKETDSIKYFLKWSCPVTYAVANLRLALLSLSRDLACELLGASTSVSLGFYQEKVSICVYVIFWPSSAMVFWPLTIQFQSLAQDQWKNYWPFPVLVAPLSDFLQTSCARVPTSNHRVKTGQNTECLVAIPY